MAFDIIGFVDFGIIVLVLLALESFFDLRAKLRSGFANTLQEMEERKFTSLSKRIAQ